MKLVYVNELGPNFKGNYVYEFIFSSNTDVWGEEWDSNPANGKPQPPDVEYVDNVGILSKEGIEFSLVQESDYFSFVDSIDDVVALAWEKEKEDELDINIEKRLVFRFGDTKEMVNDKLYIRDLILEYDEKTELKNR
jgi:hypothetical protein|tara:strand:- start:11601 stop:12011 length:411 start_codon:yes stop_codon:yes gene_type:complete